MSSRSPEGFHPRRLPAGLLAASLMLGSSFTLTADLLHDIGWSHAPAPQPVPALSSGARLLLALALAAAVLLTTRRARPPGWTG